MKIWDDTIQKSFKKVTRSSKSIRGVDEHIKNLMHEERRIKKEYHKEQNKSGKLEQIRKEISERLTENMEKEMQKKVEEISGSKYPQAEVFKLRRQMTKTENLDFPLKDEKGNIRVTAEGIDEVINKHFEKVFDQNPVEEGWEVYWEYVSKIYEIISSKEISDDEIQEPTDEEISSIIDKLDRNKAVQGIMTIDLLKNASTNIRRAIYRCIRLCHLRNNMPDEFRIEKMVLLYKHKGKLDELDNYRGIFLRMIIVSIYQKWLYSKCAPIVDEHGSRAAFGGRKGKDTMEPLLVIKLIQDHARWTKEQMIFKFMDVEKFFDSMNFHKCMLDLHESGIREHWWKSYENINKRKTCIPYIPSGPCSKIDVNDVFVQGSCDAVLMAWNHMDSLNKKEKNMWSKSCIIQGVEIDTLTFVDDIFEVMKNKMDVILSSARSEVFQGETRLRFNPPKCKILIMNKKEEIDDNICGKRLAIVDEHEYLGTLVSNNGLRVAEINKRIKDSHSVTNEIVQVLASNELSRIRLRYAKTLTNACLDKKLTYGCAIWNKLNTTQVKDLNNLKVKLFKRLLQLSYSTPSSLIKYEFGINDIDLECCMEKIFLACKIIQKGGLGQALLSVMFEKRVPGFCTELEEALKMFNVSDTWFKKDEKKFRIELKSKIVEMQRERLLEQMICESKADQVLLNKFEFNGKMQKYLVELPFEEAKVIFMLRTRMLPTKNNFKGRWGTECSFCHEVESDAHLFSCVGYSDLLDNVCYDMFIKLEVPLDVLSDGAKKLMKVVTRLETFNN